MTTSRLLPPPSRLITLLCLSAALLHAGDKPQVIVETNVMVTMTDGVKLATDIYRPAGEHGRLPVILTRTPYNKKSSKNHGEYFASHGGVLSTHPQQGSSSYVFDPRQPVPTIGGNISSGDGIMLQGA